MNINVIILKESIVNQHTNIEMFLVIA